jgi:type IX secretion system PorP/SprF family membrane protein
MEILEFLKIRILKIKMKIIEKYISTLILAICIFASAGTVSAQQTPIYSQYMFNKFLLNPAVAGSEGYTAFNLTAREQWVGFKDAPATHALSGQFRVSPRSWLARLHQVRSRNSGPTRISRVGLGCYLFNDHRGLIDQTGFQLTYAYHIPMDEAQLSFGLSTSFVQFSVNKAKLRLEDSNDPLVLNSSLNSISPDFSVGAYYTAMDWYLGFSGVQLLQSALKFGDVGASSFIQHRHYYLMGGYRFSLDRDYSIEPSAFFKSTEQFANQLDLGARVYYKNDYWGGLAFRTGGWAILTAGMRYDRFYFGYSFDYSFNTIQSHSYGSHEFMISYKFGMNVRQYKWLERY